jgi:hypothetical protein
VEFETGLLPMGGDLCQNCLDEWMKIMHVIVMYENNS